MKIRESRDQKAPPARSFDDHYARIFEQRLPRTEKDELLLELYEQLQEKYSTRAPATRV